MALSKEERQRKLRQVIEANPFLTDEELARMLAVSVSTIRLDRAELGIPELRERLRQMAGEHYRKLRALRDQELIGELLDLQLDKEAMSLLTIEEDMVLKGSGVARGHYLFAQANSLAVALVDAPQALTARAVVNFLRPVKVGQKVLARATVKSRQGKKYVIQVYSRVEGETVMEGEFVVIAVRDGGKKD
ncbi:MAG: hypothetical protein PWQ31_41 [Eubacteriales bacterium]|nr:hypothetical protein [Eubacteriales bacterium]